MKRVIQNSFHALENYKRPYAVSQELKERVDRANPELLIKHGRLPDDQWQKIWEEHVKKTIRELMQ